MLTVPLTSGLVVPVGVAEMRRMQPRETTRIEPVSGSIALDGEREIEVGPGDYVEVRLDTSSPLTLDVGAVMQEAARRSLLNGDFRA